MEEYKQHFSNQVVLITGGAGAIGSNLTRAIANCGAQRVIVLDDLSASSQWNIPSLSNVLFVKGCVTDPVVLKRVFQDKPTTVFHLAAFFANQNSVDYPERDLMVNGMGTLRLFEMAQLASVERFIYASSGCAVYGTENELPLREAQVSLHLTTPYQITKMLGELYGNFFLHQYKLKIVKPRFFNSFGPGEVPGQYRNVIPNMIYKALRGEPLPLTCVEHATRDFTYVDDIVDALLRCAYYEAAIGEEMNIASGVETRIVSLASRINELTGNTAGVLHAPSRKWDTKHRSLASIEKASEKIGYQPQVSFDEGLRRTIQWFRDHWDQIEGSESFPPGQSAAASGVLASKHHYRGHRAHIAS